MSQFVKPRTFLWKCCALGVKKLQLDTLDVKLKTDNPCPIHFIPCDFPMKKSSRRAGVQETRHMLQEIDRLAKENAQCAKELAALREELKLTGANYERAEEEIGRLRRMLKKLINSTDPAIDLDA